MPAVRNFSAVEQDIFLYLAGAAVILGHNFPIYTGFKGGKGTASIIGILLATYWPIGLIRTFIISRYYFINGLFINRCVCILFCIYRSIHLVCRRSWTNGYCRFFICHGSLFYISKTSVVWCVRKNQEYRRF